MSKVVIRNRKATYDYHLLDRYEAGIVLKGSEVKSIRQGKASLQDAYCYFKGDELYIKNFYIAPYEQSGVFNHEPRRERKLLLHKRELRKLKQKVQERGLTIIPVRLYFNKRNYAKLEIALAKGKKKYDKREAIKRREAERAIRRKIFNY